MCISTAAFAAIVTNADHLGDDCDATTPLPTPPVVIPPAPTVKDPVDGQRAGAILFPSAFPFTTPEFGFVTFEDMTAAACGTTITSCTGTCVTASTYGLDNTVAGTHALIIHEYAADGKFLSIRILLLTFIFIRFISWCL